MPNGQGLGAVAGEWGGGGRRRQRPREPWSRGGKGREEERGSRGREGGSEEREWGGALAELTASVLAGTRIMGKEITADAERPCGKDGGLAGHQRRQQR